MTSSASNPNTKRNLSGYIGLLCIAALIAGTMDGAAAVLILAKGNFSGVFRYVASGAFGKAAFTDNGMVILGVLAHYFIATCFTIFYFIIYPAVPLLRKNLLLSAVIYGLFTWAVMNLIVLHFTQIKLKPFNPQNALTNAVILMVCIGLPVSYFRRKVV